MKKFRVTYWNVDKDRMESLEFHSKIEADAFARRLKKSVEIVRMK